VNRFFAAILLFSAFTFGQSTAVQSPAATEKSVLAWLVGGMPAEHLRALAAKGVMVHDVEAFRAELQQAGADAGLIKEVISAAKAGAEPCGTSCSSLLDAAKFGRDKDFTEAVKAFVSGPEAQSDPDIMFAGAGLMRQAEAFDAAGQLYSRIVLLQPGFADAHEGFSYAEYRMGDAETAITQAKIALSLQPDHIAHKYLGLAYEVAEDYDSAIKQYEAALALQPGYADALFDEAISYDKKGDQKQAIELLQHAAQINPNDPWIFYNMGNDYSHAGNLEMAIESLKKAKALAPDELNIRQNLGAAYCEAKQPENAVAEFTELLKMDPQWNDARPCLAQSLLDLNRLNEAVEVYKAAYEQDPSDLDTAEHYAYELLMVRKPAESARVYQAVIAREGDNPDVRFWYGSALIESGQREKGLANMKIAAQFDENYRSAYEDELKKPDKKKN
jgi:tetratricopeptide (TPR) repeat protein